MADISAADIKKLREATGAGMLDCKNALVETGGDYEKAHELLRIKGLKGVAKREGRSASNGLVAAEVRPDVGVLLEINCETDFVAKSARFLELAGEVVRHLADADLDELEHVLSSEIRPGVTVQSVLDEANATLGEKIELRRFSRFKGGTITAYLHKTSPDLPPQIAVLVQFEGGDNPDVTKHIAQHIAASPPEYVTRDEVPAEIVESERRIAEATAREEGKPDAALPKIVEGRVNGFFKEKVLVEQSFVKDQKKTVGAVLQEAGMTVLKFARYRVGQP